MIKKQKAVFGNEQVDTHIKDAKVTQVFDKVAEKYDLMNDIMSLSLHRVWKNMAIDALRINRSGRRHRLLDLAAGTGDISWRLSKRYDKNVQITLCDPNEKMLQAAKDKYRGKACAADWIFVKSSAESMPFEDNSFDGVIMSFGLRNCTDVDIALGEIYRILRPLGIFVCLEFSMPKPGVIGSLYDFYSFTFLPALGAALVMDAQPYRYLAQSIRSFITPARLQQKMRCCGFSRPKYTSIEQGIVSLYSTYKLR